MSLQIGGNNDRSRKKVASLLLYRTPTGETYWIGKSDKSRIEERNQAGNSRRIYGYNVYITGMARGTDLWAAEIILDLRRKNKDLKLICAIPYEGFERRWSEDWQKLYLKILAKADMVRVIGKGYHPGIFQMRNEWMVLCEALHNTIYEKQTIM